MVDKILEDVKNIWVNITAFILFVLLVITFPVWVIPYAVYKKIKSVILSKGGAGE